MSFSRHNHFVPELYLKHFASNDGAVRMYRVLVSREKVPLWKRVHVGGVGYQTNLYTRLALGVESDEIEQWLNRDFETPAQEAIAKATEGARLVASDWEVLARFAAAQIVRTPAFLNENLPRWNSMAPILMEDALKNLDRKLEVAKNTGAQITTRKTPNSEYFPLSVSEEHDPETKMVKVQAKVVVGRSFWIYVMRHLLTSTLNAIQNHKWSILHPADELTWFTSDDPVIRLNYHSERKYDFRGGWDSKGTEILLPLSPMHLLYTHIGNRPPMRRWAFSRAQTNIIRRIIAEHAHRQIFASFEDEEIPRLRPRHVNSEVLEAEKEQWRKWHTEQTQAERDLGR